MRVLIVLLALVVTAFLTGASQTQSGSSQGDVCANDAAREDVEEAEDASHEDVEHEDVDEDEDRGCDPNPPPAPPPAGTLTIDGTVFEAIAGSPWELGCRAQRHGHGNGTHRRHYGAIRLHGSRIRHVHVCEVVQHGWRQTFPPQGTPCLTGVGYTFTLTAASSASFVDFGNVRQ